MKQFFLFFALMCAFTGGVAAQTADDFFLKYKVIIRASKSNVRFMIQLDPEAKISLERASYARAGSFLTKYASSDLLDTLIKTKVFRPFQTMQLEGKMVYITFREKLTKEERVQAINELMFMVAKENGFFDANQEPHCYRLANKDKRAGVCRWRCRVYQ